MNTTTIQIYSQDRLNAIGWRGPRGFVNNSRFSPLMDNSYTREILSNWNPTTPNIIETLGYIPQITLDGIHNAKSPEFTPSFTGYDRVRACLTNAKYILNFLNHPSIEWMEELNLVHSTHDTLSTSTVFGSGPNKMMKSIVTSLDRAYRNKRAINIQEIFRVIHYDSDAGTYICQSTSMTNEDSDDELADPAPFDCRIAAHTFPLFLIHESMIPETRHESDVSPTAVKVKRLGFGDNIVITSGDYTENAAPALRAVHSENGLYDIVINSSSWSRNGYNMFGFVADRTDSLNQKSTYTAGEYFSLAIGVGRLQQVMNIASETPVADDPEKPDWIHTHFDKRLPRRIELRTPPPSGGKSDIVRCVECNGRVIVFVDSDVSNPNCRCPHCKAPSGIQFPQLLNGTQEGDATPIGQEAE